MLIKDYYKILNVPPAATIQEIKKSFRRLAQQYHPDKNAGNAVAAAHFREIQEAYKVLTDPRQREEYNYKRWYNRSTGQSFAQPALTPPAILEQCRLLKNYVASMNVFHINYDALSAHIRQLLTGDTIGILHQYNDVAINREIVNTLLPAADPLPVRYLLPITDLLTQVAGHDAPALTAIRQALQQKKQRQLWDKYKWVLMLLLTALMCWLMYRYGK